MRELLIEQGYCVISNVLDDDLRRQLIETTDRVVEEQGTEHAVRQRTTGSMVPITSDPIYAELITLPTALQALAALGYPEAVFSDGWVISKPGGGPRLFWHSDWFAWEDKASYRAEPLQISLMYYLNDTHVSNGCLRVIPGSHNRRNPLHDVLSTPRDQLSSGDQLASPEFDDRPDEVDVPINAGDLLIADARLLHASHANQTDDRRRLITLWYQPDFVSLPERVQAQMAAKVQKPPKHWPETAQAALRAISTRYDGDAKPYEDPSTHRILR